MRKLFAILAAAIFLGGCSSTSTVYDGDDWSATTDGSTLVFSVRGNASTGGSWVVDSVGDHVELTSIEYQEDEHEEGMSGVGGTYVMTFEALADGNAKVDMHYGQNWDGGETWKTGELLLVIKDGRQFAYLSFQEEDTAQ